MIMIAFSNSEEKYGSIINSNNLKDINDSYEKINIY
jgi:hypothetical protein